MIAEGDTVSVRFVVDATHKGNLLGIPATNRRVEWTAIDIYRIVDGKIVEEWAADDVLAILHGVGAYSPPWLTSRS
jgi:predicted ester cyclase